MKTVANANDDASRNAVHLKFDDFLIYYLSVAYFIKKYISLFLLHWLTQQEPFSRLKIIKSYCDPSWQMNAALDWTEGELGDNVDFEANYQSLCTEEVL